MIPNSSKIKNSTKKMVGESKNYSNYEGLPSYTAKRPVMDSSLLPIGKSLTSHFTHSVRSNFNNRMTPQTSLASKTLQSAGMFAAQGRNNIFSVNENLKLSKHSEAKSPSPYSNT